MTCHRLDDDDALAVVMEAPDRHTRQCPDCNARLRGYHRIAGWIAAGTIGHRESRESRRRTLVQLLASARTASAPSALVQTLTQAPRPDEMPCKRVVPASIVRGARPWLAAIASAAIVVVALVAVMTRRDEPAVTIATGTSQPAAPPLNPAGASAIAGDASANASLDASRTPSSESPEGSHRRRGVTVTIEIPAQDAAIPAPATIDVSIDTTPPGARVLLNGAVLGTTPYRGSLPRSDHPLELAISRESYVDEVITIDPSRPVARQIRLVPIQQER